MNKNKTFFILDASISQKLKLITRLLYDLKYVDLLFLLVKIS